MRLQYFVLGILAFTLTNCTTPPLSVSPGDATAIDPADGGSSSDGGTSSDAGPTAAACPPDFIDDAGRCELCFDYDLDLGSAEKVRARRLRRRGTQEWEPGCEPFTRPGTVLWRPPYDGTWLIDVYGSEASVLKGRYDPTCKSNNVAFACDNPSWKPYVVTLRAGEPIVVAVDRDVSGGQNRGPGNLMVNIVPLRTEELGAECLDSSDNDLDGLADCDDPTCAASPECTTPLCAEETLPSVLPVTAEGELTIEDHVNRFQICGSSKTRQRVFAWQSPVTGRVVVDSNRSTFLSRLSVRRGTCFAPDEGRCPARDPYESGAYATMGLDVSEGEWLYVIVGGISDSLAFGPGNSRTHYQLVIHAAEDETGERCHDGIDNDGDGTADWYDDDCDDEYENPHK